MKINYRIGVAVLTLAILMALFAGLQHVLAASGSPTGITVTDGLGTPLPALIYRNGTLAVTVTNAAAYPIILEVAAGDQLVALAPRQVITTSKGDHDFPLFAPFGAGSDTALVATTTNLRRGAGGVLVADTVTAPGSPLTLSAPATQTLLLYNLVVSLGWDADAAAVNDLATGLTRASNILINSTNGQLALGRVRIVGGGARWHDADLVVSPANGSRPTADIGGIAGAAFTYHQTYSPGQIRVGRGWDGNLGGSGLWAKSPGFRALAHELGHYALFLYDEYFGPGPSAGSNVWTHCVQPFQTLSANQPSLMYYPYTASELAYDDGTNTQWNADCTITQQAVLHGESDWETILNVYNGLLGNGTWALQAPLGGPLAGPQNLPSYLVRFPQIDNAVLAPPAPLYTLQINRPPGAAKTVRVFVVRSGGAAVDQVLYQGQTDGSSLDLLGAKPGDAVWAYDASGSASGSVTLGAPPNATVTLSAAAWVPQVEIQPLGSTGLAITVKGAPAALSGLQAFIFDDPGFPAGSTALSPQGGGVWQGSLAAVPAAGHIQLLPAPLPPYEPLWLNYSLISGGGTADRNGHAPDGNLEVQENTTGIQEDFVLTDSWGPQCALPDRWQAVSLPFNFRTAQPATFVPTLIHRRYPQAAVSNQAESCLVVAACNPGNQEWVPLDSRLDPQLNIVATALSNSGAFMVIGPSTGCGSKSANQAVVAPLEPFSYTIRLVNPYNTSWGPLQVTDALPPQTTWNGVNLMPSAGFAYVTNNTVYWENIFLPPFAAAQLTVGVRVDRPPLDTLYLTNVAHVQGDNAAFDLPAVQTLLRCGYDLNCDGVINVLDLQLVAEAWQSEIDDGVYNPRYDLRADGRIDIGDIEIEAAHLP